MRSLTGARAVRAGRWHPSSPLRGQWPSQRIRGRKGCQRRGWGRRGAALSLCVGWSNINRKTSDTVVLTMNGSIVTKVVVFRGNLRIHNHFIFCLGDLHCFLMTMLPLSTGDALYSLRQSLKDANNVLQSWDPTLVNPCTWFHVMCNNDNSVIRV